MCKRPVIMCHECDLCSETPVWEQSGHTLSTTKMTISTHLAPPQPAPGLWLKTQHANPACSNRLGA